MTDAKKPRKPQEHKTVWVEILEKESVDDWSPVMECESTDEAKKWLREHGANGMEYRAITVQFQKKLTRTPVTKEKVSFE